MPKFFDKKKGMTLVETIIYTLILVIVITVIFQTLTSIVKSHRLARLERSLDSSGTVAMERMLREIRNATYVDIPASTLGASPGLLKLSGRDENWVNYTVTFDASSGAVTMAKNNNPPENLTIPGINTDSLVFRHLSNSASEGVRVELSLSGSSGTTIRSIDLFGFTVLRNSY